MSKAINVPANSVLRYIWFSNVNSLKSIDLSECLVFGQRSGKEELDRTVGSCIMACDCPSPEWIILPEKG